MYKQFINCFAIIFIKFKQGNWKLRDYQIKIFNTLATAMSAGLKFFLFKNKF